MDELGFSEPKEIQEKTMTRISGGQDIVAIGPEGSGKTTTYVLSVLIRLKFAHEEAPRALVLVPDKERVLQVVDQFNLLGKNTSIRTLGLISGVGMEPQLDALADGVDVVVGTPDRVRAIYLKLALNMNKILMFILDDAELLIKHGFQLPVSEIARSLPKTQHLVFTELLHDKIQKVITPFLSFPHYIEVFQSNEPKMEIYEHELYHVPNFRTKLNLLSILISNMFPEKKALVLVNTKQNADKVYTRLFQRIGKEAQLHKTINIEEEGLTFIEEFKKSSTARVLVVPNEEPVQWDLHGFEIIIQFELPENKEKVIELIEKRIQEDRTNPTILTFATDIELILVKKVEQAIGIKLNPQELPVDLVIEQDLDKDEEGKKTITKSKDISVSSGGAFHEKKESNNKQYNYGYKEKRKMSGKVSKRRDR